MEIELRAKIFNLKFLKERLKQINASFLKSVRITDYYFGDLGLYEKIGHSFWIRVRAKDGKVEIAYKGPTKHDGIYEEYEQSTQDLKTTLKIFEKIGLDNPITIKKKREKYVLGDINIEIDEIENYGTFLELEKISNNKSKKDLFDLMNRLGIHKDQIFEKGYITLILKESNSPFSKWVVN